MRYPGVVSPGRKTGALFSHLDFAPTLLSLCGLPVPEELRGADFSRIARPKAENGPDSVLFQIYGPYQGDGTERAWRGLNTALHVCAMGVGAVASRDLQQDPDELHNLVNNTAHLPDLKELDKQLLDWMTRAGDSWSLDWTAPVEDEVRLDKYRAFYSVQDYLAWAKSHSSLSPGIP